ncbi:hypothetical protein B0H14DRAFT_2889893 [Mycena olivaceomarginata]|nr:hypothetical protein B0H14DRAFT_2889893 [Mycena olivaceomarginata]
MYCRKLHPCSAIDQPGFPTSSQMDTLLEFAQTTTTATRQKRTCHKCRQDDCKGSNMRELCKNPCADCNRRSCEGRSSAQKNVKCGLS